MRDAHKEALFRQVRDPKEEAAYADALSADELRAWTHALNAHVRQHCKISARDVFQSYPWWAPLAYVAFMLAVVLPGMRWLARETGAPGTAPSAVAATHPSEPQVMDARIALPPHQQQVSPHGKSDAQATSSEAQQRRNDEMQGATGHAQIVDHGKPERERSAGIEHAGGVIGEQPRHADRPDQQQGHKKPLASAGCLAPLELPVGLRRCHSVMRAAQAQRQPMRPTGGDWPAVAVPSSQAPRGAA